MLIAPRHRQHPALPVLVAQAEHVLSRDGWTVVERDTRSTAPWHIVAERGARRRVVQISPPETPLAERQARCQALGATARLTPREGTMEQWLAHLRPDGRVTFGPYVLNGQRWNV